MKSNKKKFKGSHKRPEPIPSFRNEEQHGERFRDTLHSPNEDSDYSYSRGGGNKCSEEVTRPKKHGRQGKDPRV